MKRLSFWIFVGLTISPLCSGYEITTHALITSKAFDTSVLNPSDPKTIIPVLGFDRLDQDYPFSFLGGQASTDYRDETARMNPVNAVPSFTDDYARSVQEQERNVLQTLVSRGSLTGVSGALAEQRVRSWLLRGAVREDDNDAFVLGKWRTSDKRDPDPFGPLLRAGRHFYDPLYDRAFDYPDDCTVYGCIRSVVWAMGRTNPLNPPSDADDTTRRNHFTWQDARNNEWWALTLKRDVSADGYDYGDAGRDANERMERWATSVKSLGHVIHLLEDTAQPQHVRNDAHAPPVKAGMTPGEGVADAAFEAFTDYRVIRDFRAAAQFMFPTGNPLRRMVGGGLPQVNSLPPVRLGDGNPYPGGGTVVQFGTATKFFTTRAVESGTDVTSLRNRRGLADMSNRNFFTAGTLPGFRECQPPGTVGCIPSSGPTYPLPLNDLTDASYSRVDLGEGLGLRVGDRLVYTTEYTQAVSDSVVSGYDAAALAPYGGKAPLVTESIWQDLIPDDMGSFREELGFTLTYSNLRYMADVMMPRAVGYSAGLINYFFRGRLEITPVEQGIVGVMNQADPHTVDVSGYPRPFMAPTRIFGFEKLRLRVRNASESISESGTGMVIPQTTGGSNARLVAIAKYHRNRCYAQDLSGERVRDFSGAITEPTCANGVRTPIQEILSAPRWRWLTGNSMSLCR